MVVLAAVALSLALRILFLLRRPLWEDEIFTVWAARLSPSKLLDLLRNDSGPPLFYLLEKPFVSLSETLASSDLLARALPFLGAALLFAGAAFLPHNGPRRRFLLLAASSPLLLVYSAEARAYALLALFSFLLFVLVLELDWLRRRVWMIAALAAAALYTHYLALFVVATLLAISLLSGRRREAVGLLAGGALFLPWVPVLLSQPAAALAWSEERTLSSATGFLSALGGAARIAAPFGPGLPRTIAVAGLLFGGLLLLLLLFHSRRDASVRRAVLFVLGVLASILVISFWRPIAFAGRSEMAALPVWLWALSRGSERSLPIRWGTWGVIVVGFAACVSISSAKFPVPAARAALALLSHEAREGDVLFAGAGFYLPARLAFERRELWTPVRPFPASVADHPGWFAPDTPTDRDYRSLAAARSLVDARVFLLIPASYRTPAVDAIGAPSGWREIGRSRAGILLVSE